ncbi:DNA-binding helix-turn-helix protein [Pseudoramibacter alactolyticus ATCC 23263]|uniref:DNA-binding helix-turn-helix protein n=1 Tax=Pseudoramibacter alactolyticus ATCC 23263 TaxID=887929 RepID=E6MIR0_9FIRM|nr:helix-turn-helix transcriptional regulator [Pseudoramibacter alactolyticus]EFV01156.1 DNA-binding helix-turn-helix protein [Pseudoramibacter alactolyticus ATCC 23263]
MSEITVGIGHNIRIYRKKNGLTLDALSDLVFKSKSALSKYENGDISIDIETLYELAEALHIHVEQLLYVRKSNTKITTSDAQPSFFNGVSRFYSYVFDGRSHQLLPSVFDILSETDKNQFKIMMYMNYKTYDHYQDCETTYIGYIEHYDAVTNIMLTNQHSPMEKASAQILASYLDSDMKWGLWNGLSSRPLMPIATKMLFTKNRLRGKEDIINDLKISKEDIKLLRLYNMLPVL